jgi:hypothetical protein
MYSPAGEKYETSDRSEINRLVAAGYTEKKPTPTQIKAVVGEKS